MATSWTWAGDEAEEAGDVGLDLGGDPAERLLGQAQHRQQRAPLVRVGRLELAHAPELLVGEDHRAAARADAHRSSSPAIMLTEPNVGTMSATIAPSIIRGIAAVGGRQGGRQRTRYGRSVPSETT